MPWEEQSNYKKKKGWTDWWDEPIFEDSYSPTDPYYDYGETTTPKYGGYGRNGYVDTGYSYGGGYSGYYKPKYDMSVSLETRVVQLIKTVTGRELRLQQAKGWGNDDQYFYYNPSDLENATDDEVLGRILHQLAKERHVDRQQLKKESDSEPAYRHLLNSLEDNRSDRQLQKDYPGVRYYADEMWDVRKFADNPMNFYGNDGTDGLLDLAFDRWMTEKMDDDHPSHEYRLAWKSKTEPLYTSLKRAVDSEFPSSDEPQNDAWEFNFNINALQNGEEQFDFTKDEIAGNFEKALPHINEYLNASTFEEALRIYPEIKKYYPVPDEQQQQQMDRMMGQTQGLSQSEMEEAAKRALALAERDKKGMDGEGAEGFIDMETDIEFANDNTMGELYQERELSTYRKYQAQYQGTINTLHALIQSILKDNTVKRYQRPFKRGKIDSKRMYKYIATDNLRIFKKSRAVSKQHYPMTIVVDLSGSMRGEESKWATKGTIVLAEVLEKLGFPYEIIGYNGDVYNFKKFNEPLRRELIPSIEQANGGNNELKTIGVVTEHIKRFDPVDEHKKTVFWVTDGEAHQPHQVHKKVLALEKDHRTKVYAIGIGGVRDEALKTSYPRWLNIKDVKELPRELISLMRAQFRRE